MDTPLAAPATAAVTTPARRLTDRTRVRWLAERTLPIVVLVLTVLVILIPVYYVFRTAFADGADGVRRLLATDQFWQVLRTTFWLTLGATAVAMVCGVGLAWFAHRLPPGRRWLGYLPFVPLVVPQLALVTGYTFLLSPRVGFLNSALRHVPPFRGDETGPIDVYTLPLMIVILGTSLAAFVFLFVRSSLAQLHQDVIDAASACGAGSIAVFWRIVLPLIRPALVYGALTVALLGFGQFTVPLILGRQESINVLTTQMYNKLSRYPTDFALASAYGVPILALGLLFLVAQRILLRGQDRYATTSGRSARPLSTNGPLAQTLLILYALLTVVLPVGALIVVSLQPTWVAAIHPGDFTLANYRDVFTNRPDLLTAVWHTLEYAAGTIVLAVPVGYVCAHAIYRRRNHPLLANVQDIVISLPLGIPAVIFGTGFLLAFTQGPFRLYGTPWAMILVFATMMVPYATRLQLVAMIGIGGDLNDAAAANGAGPLRLLLAVEAPLLRPTLGFLVALIVVLTTHEFAAALLVRSQNTQVMGTVLYDLYAFGSYPTTAVMTIVMCLVTLLGVGLALLIGGSSALGTTDRMG